MKILEKMKNRYAVKSYDQTKKIPTEDLEELKRILHLSPSSINGQPWQFIFVTDTDVKTQLAEASYFNSQKIKEASCLVVLNSISSSDYFEEKIKEYLPEGFIGYYKEALKPLGNDAVVNWMIHQVYLTQGVLLSACAMMNIDSTPMEGIDPDKYSEILDLKNYKPVVAVALGYRSPRDKYQPTLTAKRRVDFNEIVKSI